MAATGRKIHRTKDRADFVPLDYDLDVEKLITENENFEALPTLDATQLVGDGMNRTLLGVIQKHVVMEGRPLCIRNWHKRSEWPWYMFNPKWLEENHGRDHIAVRDLIKGQDIVMSLGHYLRNMARLSDFHVPGIRTSKQRLYAKDLDCPPVWRDKLSQTIPASTFYLSSQGDLMSSLPPSARAENMMCYFGHQGTYTPFHKEMCASLGQNIMVHTSNGGTDGTRAGSSVWFMTASVDREAIAEYWLSQLGHDVEVEAHFASVQDLARAPFKVYVHEQILGDYILIPPLAPHQVWNRGDVTMKAAWNRTTVETLGLAITESLPKARLVCRDEQYKNRAIIHETLRIWADVLNGGRDIPKDVDKCRMENNFAKLFNYFNRILIDESFGPNMSMPDVERIDNEYNVTCSFCRANIWNRFLTCKQCIDISDTDDDPYDICMDCYARGRSCFCISQLNWVEQHDWTALVHDHETFRRIVEMVKDVPSVDIPVPLSRGIKQFGRKTLAQVCQEQLNTRPWQDLTKNGLEEEEADDGDTVKRKKREGKNLNCHVCKIRHDTWKCVECSTCSRAYCYGNLWRAFDQDPFDDILSQYVWKCPHCRGFCSCGACRHKTDQEPYEPRGTFLGVSTKHVADPRSVESLVDFGKGNLSWMLKTGEVDDMGGSLKRKHHPGNGGRGLDDFCDHTTPIDPSLSDVAHDGNGVSTGFTAVNGHEEGMSLLASNANDDGGDSNGLVSEQAHITKNSLNQARSDPVYRDGRDTGPKVIAEMLPSSSAILTGALPSFKAGISGGSVHGAMGTSSSSSSSYFNQTYPAPSVWDGNLHSGAVASSVSLNINPSRNFMENNPSGTMPLTALEENPLAFIAAAGLLQSDSLSTERSVTTTGDQPAGIQPQLLRNTPPLAPSPPASTAIMTPSRKAPLHHKGSKLKPDLPFVPPRLPPERESVVGDWVRKTKVASRWAKNLKKKSRLVILRPPVVRFKELAEEIMEKDKVASDLVLVAPGLYAPVPRSIRSVSPEKKPFSGPTVKRKRGRPRKSETVEVSGDDGSDRNDEATSVNIEIQKLKAKERRQSAYVRRKKEEEEAKAAFLKSQPRRKTAGGIPVTSIEPRNRVKNADVLAVLQTQLPGDASLSLNQATEEVEDTFSPAASTGPSLVEETEEEKAARRKWEEEEHTLAASVAEEARIRQEEAAKRAAAAVERRAGEKVARKAQRARLLMEEKQRCRREADRKAKLVAAGMLDESEYEEYISSLESGFSSPESEAPDLEGEAPEQLLPAETFNPPLQIDQFNSGNVTALIPLNWPFAVMVEQPSIRNWRKLYAPILDPSLPLRLAKHHSDRSRKHPFPTAIVPTPSSEVTAIAKRRKSSTDTIFRAGWVAGESGAAVGVEVKGRERRRTAREGIRHDVDLEDEEWEDGREKIVKKEKKRASRKVEIVPGRWAEVEITESEDEEDEDVQMSGGEGLEAAGERGVAEEVPVREGGKDVEMEVGERRWNNRKRGSWF